MADKENTVKTEYVVSGEERRIFEDGIAYALGLVENFSLLEVSRDPKGSTGNAIEDFRLFALKVQRHFEERERIRERYGISFEEQEGYSSKIAKAQDPSQFYPTELKKREGEKE